MSTFINKFNIPLPKSLFPGYTIYQAKDGTWKTRKIGITRDQVKKDPAFINSRKSASEFGKAAKTGSLILQAFKEQLAGVDKRKLSGQLTKVILKGMRADQGNPAGKRTLFHGHADLLRGFQLNTRNKLDAVSHISFTVQENLKMGHAIVEIPSFVPRSHLHSSASVTHFRIVSVSGMINPEMDFYDTDSKATELTPFTSSNIKPSALTVKLAKVEGYINLVAIGIEFYQVVNKRAHIFNTANALEIVKVIKGSPNLKT